MLSKKQIKEIALETLKQLEQEKNKKSEIF